MDNFFVKYNSDFYNRNGYDILPSIVVPDVEAPTVETYFPSSKTTTPKSEWATSSVTSNIDPTTISSSLTTTPGIGNSTLASIAKNAKTSGTGKCAHNVSNYITDYFKLKGLNVNFNRRDAWDYDKTLAEVGAKEVSDPQEGDLVWTKNTKDHSHIAILVRGDDGLLYQKSDSTLKHKFDSTVYGGKGTVKYFRLAKQGMKIRFAKEGMQWAEYTGSTPTTIAPEIEVPDFISGYNLSYPDLNITTKDKTEVPTYNWAKSLYTSTTPIMEKTLPLNIEVPYKEGENSNAYKVKEFLTKKGLKDYQVAGLMGNFDWESGGFNTNATDGKAKGIALWQGDRLANLQKKYGANPNLDLLLEFMWDELNTSEKAALDSLLKTTNVAEATKVVMNKYERPNAALAHYADRLARAQNHLKK